MEGRLTMEGCSLAKSQCKRDITSSRYPYADRPRGCPVRTAECPPLPPKCPLAGVEDPCGVCPLKNRHGPCSVSQAMNSFKPGMEDYKTTGPVVVPPKCPMTKSSPAPCPLSEYVRRNQKSGSSPVECPIACLAPPRCPLTISDPEQRKQASTPICILKNLSEPPEFNVSQQLRNPNTCPVSKTHKCPMKKVIRSKHQDLEKRPKCPLNCITAGLKKCPFTSNSNAACVEKGCQKEGAVERKRFELTNTPIILATMSSNPTTCRHAERFGFSVSSNKTFSKIHPGMSLYSMFCPFSSVPEMCACCRKRCEQCPQNCPCCQPKCCCFRPLCVCCPPPPRCNCTKPCDSGPPECCKQSGCPLQPCPPPPCPLTCPPPPPSCPLACPPPPCPLVCPPPPCPLSRPRPSCPFACPPPSPCRLSCPPPPCPISYPPPQCELANFTKKTLEKQLDAEQSLAVLTENHCPKVPVSHSEITHQRNRKYCFNEKDECKKQANLLEKIKNVCPFYPNPCPLTSDCPGALIRQMRAQQGQSLLPRNDSKTHNPTDVKVSKREKKYALPSSEPSRHDQSISSENVVKITKEVRTVHVAETKLPEVKSTTESSGTVISVISMYHKSTQIGRKKVRKVADSTCMYDKQNECPLSNLLTKTLPVPDVSCPFVPPPPCPVDEILEKKMKEGPSKSVLSGVMPCGVRGCPYNSETKSGKENVKGDDNLLPHGPADCPVLTRPCSLFPKGRCPMNELHTCDCDYPLPPCMQPLQCGETEPPPPQFCFKKDCCMGLPTPPVKKSKNSINEKRLADGRSGGGGDYDVLTSEDEARPVYYKFMETKPGKEETKYFVEIKSDLSDQKFGQTPGEKRFPYSTVLKNDTGYLKCKRVQESLAKRLPSADKASQYDPNDCPDDPFIKAAMQARKKSEKNL